MTDSDTILLRNRREEIDRCAQRILDALDRHDYPEASRFAIRLAFEESVSNALNHGQRGRPADEPIRVEYAVDDQRVRLAVEDNGPGFKPEQVPDPTAEGNLEIPTGRGLLLIRAYMASVEYNERGNRVEMVYQRPAE